MISDRSYQSFYNSFCISKKWTYQVPAHIISGWSDTQNSPSSHCGQSVESSQKFWAHRSPGDDWVITIIIIEIKVNILILSLSLSLSLSLFLLSEPQNNTFFYESSVRKWTVWKWWNKRTFRYVDFMFFVSLSYDERLNEIYMIFSINPNIYTYM